MKDTRITNYVVALILLALLLNKGMVGSGYGSNLKPASIPTSSYWLPKQPLLCSSRRAHQAKAFSALEKSPLSFIENRGQVDPRVAYYVQGHDTTIYFTRQGLTLALLDKDEAQQVADNLGSRGAGKAIIPTPKSKQLKTARRWPVNLDFLGANRNVKPTAQNPTSTTISYFKGPKDQWKTGLASYSTLVYPNLWPGIDLVYSGTANRLKYEFIVKPGADPKRIRLAYSGATDVKLNRSGQLEVITPVAGFRDDRPISFQELNGKQTEIVTSFKLDNDKTKSRTLAMASV
jgi:hypothetical protein